ncbi:MAG: NYN domain-containing protein [Gemmatimonadota bacterium]
MSEESRIAVFVDYENLALGVRDKSSPFQVELVLNRLLEKGRIVFKRAYCDWRNYQQATRELHLLGIELVDIPQTRTSGKNSADIHMVVDAVDLCYSKQHIDTFALVTGDSDFSPLASKLKENDKRVVGCGVRDSTSDLLIRSCDEFIYYDVLADASRKAVSARKSETKRKTKGGQTVRREDRQEEAVDKLVQVVASLEADYDPLWGSLVKQTLRRVDPGFHERNYGYKSFTDLMEEAAAAGLLDLEYDDQRGNFKVSLRAD